MLELKRTQIRSGYVLAFFLLLFSYLLIFSTTRRLRKETAAIAHNYSIINKLQEFYFTVTEAEAGVRGYIITRQRSFLEPYRQSRQKIPTVFRELQLLTSGEAKVRDQLGELKELTDNRFSLLEHTLAAFQNSGERIVNGELIITPRSKQVMDSIRSLIMLINQTEMEVMQHGKSKLSDVFSNARLVTYISLFTATLAIIYSLVTYNKENKAKKEAARRAAQYGKDLEANIRELKEMNTELTALRSIEKFAATGRIARTIAHEVRNPLTNIALASEQLDEIAPANPETSILLDMIRRNATRINQLVSDLLNATRFIQLEVRDYNINDLLEEAIEMAKDRIGLHHTRIERHYSPDICGVKVDPLKMRIAFLNIIVNAVEAVEKNSGIVQLITQKTGNKCLVEIRDNGAGMDEETLHQIFEPYFTGKPKGNGLGLTNTENIILTHKGTIKVQSKPGAGTSFFITLDLTELP